MSFEGRDKAPSALLVHPRPSAAACKCRIYILSAKRVIVRRDIVLLRHLLPLRRPHRSKLVPGSVMVVRGTTTVPMIYGRKRVTLLATTTCVVYGGFALFNYNLFCTTGSVSPQRNALAKIDGIKFYSKQMFTRWRQYYYQ